MIPCPARSTTLPILVIHSDSGNTEVDLPIPHCAARRVVNTIWRVMSTANDFVAAASSAFVNISMLDNVPGAFSCGPVRGHNSRGPGLSLPPRLAVARCCVSICSLFKPSLPVPPIIKCSRARANRILSSSSSESLSSSTKELREVLRSRKPPTGGGRRASTPSSSRVCSPSKVEYTAISGCMNRLSVLRTCRHAYMTSKSSSSSEIMR